MPTLVSWPLPSNTPVTPTTAFALSSASVLFGSLRSTEPFMMPAATSAGTASTSTFRPTLSAGGGLTPGPTPPFAAPAIAWCSFNAPPLKSSAPNVSMRYVCRPSSIIASADPFTGSSGATVAAAIAESCGGGASAGRALLSLLQPISIAAINAIAADRHARVRDVVRCTKHRLSVCLPLQRTQPAAALRDNVFNRRARRRRSSRHPARTRRRCRHRRRHRARSHRECRRRATDRARPAGYTHRARAPRSPRRRRAASHALRALRAPRRRERAVRIPRHELADIRLRRRTPTRRVREPGQRAERVAIVRRLRIRLAERGQTRRRRAIRALDGDPARQVLARLAQRAVGDRAEPREVCARGLPVMPLIRDARAIEDRLSRERGRRRDRRDLRERTVGRVEVVLGERRVGTRVQLLGGERRGWRGLCRRRGFRLRRR